MSTKYEPDINENHILQQSPELLAKLLRDQTTGGNILWCTHDYEHLGKGYNFNDEITPEKITGEHGMIIRPRVLKSKEQQTDRVKDMAEVFTPSWVVKMMVDYVDFDINTRCLELTCGEAPFLVSRYDATTGEPIAIDERIGILDRKLRLVNEQQPTDEEWLSLVRQSFQNTYGYEWQGDSLLLARENLLYTFIEYYESRFSFKPDIPLLQDFAEIISWNLWQMDGLSYRTPREKTEEPPQAQLSFFDEAPTEAPAPFCVIMDWQKGEAIKVNDIKKTQIQTSDSMKFDVIIGNPPYQEEVLGDNQQFAPPVYNYFIDESQKVAERVELIHPARFLFNAGSTPKNWNNKMLNDPHFKVLNYTSDSSKIFGNSVEIKGGIAITYWDRNSIYEPIRKYIASNELTCIDKKVSSAKESSFSEIVFAPERYKFTEQMHDEHPNVETMLSKGHKYDLKTAVFTKLADIVFFEDKPNDSSNYVQILGTVGGKRTFRWIKMEYLSVPDNFYRYKVLTPKANGNGTFGEALTPSIIGLPNVGHTQSFFSIGNFETIIEAENVQKYTKTRFARALLGIKKVTQENTAKVWEHVPLQDFTASSDIDWSKSVAEIDEQLFDKYGLDEQERNFIRTKVKEMA